MFIRRTLSSSRCWLGRARGVYARRRSAGSARHSCTSRIHSPPLSCILCFSDWCLIWYCFWISISISDSCNKEDGVIKNNQWSSLYIVLHAGSWMPLSRLCNHPCCPWRIRASGSNHVSAHARQARPSLHSACHSHKPASSSLLHLFHALFLPPPRRLCFFGVFGVFYDYVINYILR